MTGPRMESSTVSVRHVRMVCDRPFDDVAAALKERAPVLDPGLATALMSGNRSAVEARRAEGPPLWLFLIRDHGALLAVEGRPGKALQFEIGNPLTAESMTRHDLRAGLYAPLRVLLYEDAQGTVFFEYDLPSSLFGQFGIPEVTAVGLELDEELDALLRGAATA